MKLLLFFIAICFISGIVMQRLSTWAQMLMLLGLSALVSAGYFFFNQI